MTETYGEVISLSRVFQERMKDFARLGLVRTKKEKRAQFWKMGNIFPRPGLSEGEGPQVEVVVRTKTTKG